jgi:hypothetical protein
MTFDYDNVDREIYNSLKGEYDAIKYTDPVGGGSNEWVIINEDIISKRTPAGTRREAIKEYGDITMKEIKSKWGKTPGKELAKTTPKGYRMVSGDELEAVKNAKLKEVSVVKDPNNDDYRLIYRDTGMGETELYDKSYKTFDEALKRAKIHEAHRIRLDESIKAQAEAPLRKKRTAELEQLKESMNIIQDRMARTTNQTVRKQQATAMELIKNQIDDIRREGQDSMKKENKKSLRIK